MVKICRIMPRASDRQDSACAVLLLYRVKMYILYYGFHRRVFKIDYPVLVDRKQRRFVLD